jgi:outer membrane immunogenic protein
MEIVMKKILTAALLASVATSAFAVSALAADLPTRKAAPAPAPAYYAPPFTWTGFYVGINGGGGFGDFSGFGKTVFGSPTGGLVGGTAGYNYQIGQFVIGAEGDLDWADIQKTKSFADGSSSKAQVNSLGHVLVRGGITYDRALFYLAGGYAGGDVKGTFHDTTLAGSPTFSKDTWQNGWALGAGLEYAVTDNITVKGQYLFSQLSEKTYFAGTPDAAKSHLDINTFTAGVNYKF